MLSHLLHFHSLSEVDVKESPSKLALAAQRRNLAADLDAFL
jgi:hypothetical protein